MQLVLATILLFTSCIALSADFKIDTTTGWKKVSEAADGQVYANKSGEIVVLRTMDLSGEERVLETDLHEVSRARAKLLEGAGIRGYVILEHRRARARGVPMMDVIYARHESVTGAIKQSVERQYVVGRKLYQVIYLEKSSVLRSTERASRALDSFLPDVGRVPASEAVASESVRKGPVAQIEKGRDPLDLDSDPEVGTDEECKGVPEKYRKREVPKAKRLDLEMMKAAGCAAGAGDFATGTLKFLVSAPDAPHTLKGLSDSLFMLLYGAGKKAREYVDSKLAAKSEEPPKGALADQAAAAASIVAADVEQEREGYAMAAVAGVYNYLGRAKAYAGEELTAYDRKLRVCYNTIGRLHSACYVAGHLMSAGSGARSILAKLTGRRKLSGTESEKVGEAVKAAAGDVNAAKAESKVAESLKPGHEIVKADTGTYLVTPQGKFVRHETTDDLLNFGRHVKANVIESGGRTKIRFESGAEVDLPAMRAGDAIRLSPDEQAELLRSIASGKSFTIKPGQTGNAGEAVAAVPQTAPANTFKVDTAAGRPQLTDASGATHEIATTDDIVKLAEKTGGRVQTTKNTVMVNWNDSGGGSVHIPVSQTGEGALKIGVENQKKIFEAISRKDVFVFGKDDVLEKAATNTIAAARAQRTEEAALKAYSRAAARQAATTRAAPKARPGTTRKRDGSSY